MNITIEPQADFVLEGRGGTVLTVGHNHPVAVSHIEMTEEKLDTALYLSVSNPEFGLAIALGREDLEALVEAAWHVLLEARLSATVARWRAGAGE